MAKSLQILTASDPTSSKNLRQLLNLIKLPSFGDKNNQGLVTIAVEELKKVEDQAKKIVEENKELILGGPSKLGAMRRQNPQTVEKLTSRLNELGGSVRHMNQILGKEISTRRIASTRTQELHKRNAQVQMKENENMSLYQLFEHCLLRLGDIPNMVQCFVLGCNDGTTTESSSSTLKPTTPSSGKKPKPSADEKSDESH